MEATYLDLAPVVSRQRTHSQLVKRIKKFRLQTASVILGNPRYTKQIQDDADYRTHAFDLCDQYCLFIFLNWIARKYGFPVCVSSIERDSSTDLLPLQTWSDIAGLYPLNLPELAPEWKTAVQPLFEMLDENFTPMPEMLGELYQNIISSGLHLNDNQQIDIQANDNGRQAGEFYTPPDVVIYCLDRLLDKDSLRLMNRIKQSMAYPAYESSSANTNTCYNHTNSENALLEPDAGRRTADGEGSFKLLDPSCGTGNFLIGVIHWLRERLPDTFDPQLFITQSVYGRDIDGRAVDLCRLTLLLLCNFQLSDLQSGAQTACVIESQNISRISDTGTLTDQKRLQILMAKIRRNICVDNCVLSNVATHDEDDKFDLVVGNPPYLSFGSRNQGKLSAEWQRLLRSSFPYSTEYKIRLYSVFQELSLRLCKPGGSVSLLVPDAFLNGSFYQKLRSLILREAEITSLSELPRDSVPGAVVGNWCVACYTKRQTHERTANAPHDPIQLYRVTKCGTDSFQLDGDLFVSPDKGRFQLVFSNHDAALLRLIRNLQPLSTELKGHTGIRSRSGQSSILARTATTQAHKAGITSGSRISRHKVACADTWIEIDSAKLFAGGFDPKVIEPPKIMVRQTADRIIAALDESGLYHLNNVHSFAPAYQEFPRRQLFYLCGLLNSRMYIHLYRLKSREEGRALAQIDIEMVEAMPLPTKNEQIQEQISLAAEKLKAEHLDESATLAAEQAIDKLVYKLFDLPDDLVQHIESQFPA